MRIRLKTRLFPYNLIYGEHLRGVWHETRGHQVFALGDTVEVRLSIVLLPAGYTDQRSATGLQRAEYLSPRFSHPEHPDTAAYTANSVRACMMIASSLNSNGSTASIDEELLRKTAHFEGSPVNAPETGVEVWKHGGTQGDASIESSFIPAPLSERPEGCGRPADRGSAQGYTLSAV